jgi:hypothetical protein
MAIDGINNNIRPLANDTLSNITEQVRGLIEKVGEASVKVSISQDAANAATFLQNTQKLQVTEDILMMQLEAPRTIEKNRQNLVSIEA